MTTSKNRRPEISPRRPFSFHPGFTLAELAVVIVLVGLMLGMVMPRLGGFGDVERLRTAARRLAGQVLEAHSQAVTSAKPWFLCLDLDQKRTWLGTERPESEGEAGREGRYFVLPRGVVITDVKHPLSGTVKEGRVSFGFWPQGGGEPGTIHLKSVAGPEMTLFIRPYLGYTEIKEGYLVEEKS
ncbi:MAG: GspH/FimT family pseudopilin [Pseudomonadota bacterium]